MSYGGATVGSRTMVDALAPTLQTSTLSAMAAAAMCGRLRTLTEFIRLATPRPAPPPPLQLRLRWGCNLQHATYNVPRVNMQHASYNPAVQRAGIAWLHELGAGEGVRTRCYEL